MSANTMKQHRRPPKRRNRTEANEQRRKRRWEKHLEESKPIVEVKTVVKPIILDDKTSQGLSLEQRLVKEQSDKPIKAGANKQNETYHEKLLKTIGAKIRQSKEKQNGYETIEITPQDEDDDEADLEPAIEDNSDSDDEIGQDETSGDVSNDRFARHYEAQFTAEDLKRLESQQTHQNIKYEWPNLGSMVEVKSTDPKFDIIPLDKPLGRIDELQLRKPLQTSITKLSGLENELLSVFTTYKDFLFCEQTFDNGEEIRFAYCVHALNHILKTRTRVITHNKKLAAGQQGEYRDQGLTRPKVLILVPFRESAFRIVNCIVNMLVSGEKDAERRTVNVMNQKRFNKEFGPEPDSEGPSMKKPEDYRKTFVGNIDDNFRVGLAITNRSVKLYSEFYTSDIIIASPLGLRTIVGAEGDQSRDFDFLSSIELTILDQADLFLMQNWEHVQLLLNTLHLQPKNDHNVDYSRVKLWVLELWSKFYHQLLVFSSVPNSYIENLFHSVSENYAGKVATRNAISKSQAAISKVLLQIPQNMLRLSVNSLVTQPDERFKFFTEQILPRFRDKSFVRTLIYVPSYFDFVRLRNYFRREDLGIGQLCEYSDKGKIAKARHIFYYGGRHFLLMTERFHFFNRYNIKGIRHLIFYEPPTYARFYHELVSMMHQNNQGKKLLTDYSAMSVSVLFSKFDKDTLAGLLGTPLSRRCIASKKDEHIFVTNITNSVE